MKTEVKVGILAASAFVLVILFAYMLGMVNPFSNANELNVVYNYAGGIEQGSPVRVMGIVVGKVKEIIFDPNYKTEKGEEAKLRLVISVNKKAWSSIRTDSKFFINMAGVIGEKFLEISPGNTNEPEFVPGAVVRGDDPPRIDQLISQSYGLAGKIIDLVEKNEGSVGNLIVQLDRLTTNFNKTLVLLDKTTRNEDVNRLMTNAIKISDDVAYLTGQLRTKKSEDSFQVLHKLIMRLEPLDAAALKKFFQEEGVRAKVL